MTSSPRSFWIARLRDVRLSDGKTLYLKALEGNTASAFSASLLQGGMFAEFNYERAD